MIQMVMTGICRAGKKFFGAHKESDGVKPSYRPASKGYCAALPAVCKLLLVAILLNVFPARAQSIQYVTVGKHIEHVQTSATAVNVDPTPQGPDYGGPYGFSANVEGQDISSISAPIISGPIYVGEPFYNQGELLYNTTDGMWRMGAPNANDWGSPTLSDLNSNFGNGTYTVVVNGVPISLNLTGDAYPNIPLLTLSGGAWSNGKYIIDSSQPLTITTNAFTAYGTHQNDWIGIYIKDSTDKEQDATTVPGTNFLSYTLPANTFISGQEYIIGAWFSAAVDLNPNPALPGSTNVAFYEMFTRVTISASSPSSYPLTVAKSGSGTIASTPANISCGVSCSGSYTPGTAITLTATPASGSYFAGWSGDCSGTGSCVVTMSAARNVTATFKPLPFVATTTSNVTATSATISTRVTFNTADVNKQGSVFVTAWVPVNGLETLGISSALSGALNVTSTQDNPYTSKSVKMTMAPLSATDSSSFVMVQLTSSGWQLVVNGQLIPYASGVMGDQLAAQSILSNTNPSALVGAQFCLGYGESADEMVATGRMLPVGTLTAQNTFSSSATGSCNVAASAPASPLTGLWWNPNESGWGMSLTQIGSMAFVAWYTYDPSGKPAWYVMSSCPLVGSACTGDIYNVMGGTPLGVPWNGSGKVVSKVGTGTLSFTDDNTGAFSYSVNGVSGSRNVTRQMFGSGTSQPAIDYSALWWNESESGWGVALTQQYGTIFATMYTYDAGGNPVWYVASDCAVSGSGCSGKLYQVSGGSAPSVAWNGTNLVVTEVGTVSFSFNDSGNGTMSYSINGVTGSKAIARQLF